jgi:hypothetical protein
MPPKLKVIPAHVNMIEALRDSSLLKTALSFLAASTVPASAHLTARSQWRVHALRNDLDDSVKSDRQYRHSW